MGGGVMPRFFMHRDGCDAGYFQVLSENPVEFFARSIQREDAPGLTVERVEEMIKFTEHATDGRIAHLSCDMGGHYWVATRERSPREVARFEAEVASWRS